MSEMLSAIPERVPLVSHVALARRNGRVPVSGREVSGREVAGREGAEAASALLGPSAEALPAGSLPLRQACELVHRMTNEMIVFSADRVQLRRDKRRALCHARQIAMYVCHVTLRIPQCDVGHAYGRDRSTVRHSCAVVEDRRDRPGYDDFVGAVERLAASVFEPVEGDFHDER